MGVIRPVDSDFVGMAMMRGAQRGDRRLDEGGDGLAAPDNRSSPPCGSMLSAVRASNVASAVKMVRIPAQSLPSMKRK